jgi:lipoyl-dependent peroxiredoxin
MALKRTSTAVWHGTGPKGSGTLTTLSGAFKDQPYSAATRFQAEDGRAGTNPEELIAAAHAACFSMALSSGLAKAGNPPDELHTTATVTFQPGDGITKIALAVEGRVPGLDAAAFEEAAQDAKENCPVSKALAGVPEITLDAKLAS